MIWKWMNRHMIGLAADWRQLRAGVRPVALAQLFKTAKASIADDELMPLKQYRLRSLEEEFDSQSRRSLKEVVKKWQESSDRVLTSAKSLRRTVTALAMITLNLIIALLVSTASWPTHSTPTYAAEITVLISAVTIVVVSSLLVRISRIKTTLGTLAERKGELDQDAATALQLVLSEIKTEYGLHAYPWRMGVPYYKGTNPCRFLVERHDDYSPTKLFAKAREYVQTHDRGSIGIAGERGSGKTSMMQELKRCLAATSEGDDELQTHTVWMSVPTRVEEKDFLVSVLAKLATSVGAKLTDNTDWPDDAPEERLRKQDRRRRGMRWALGLSFVVVVALVSLHYLPEDLLSTTIWLIPADILSSQVNPYGELRAKTVLALGLAIALVIALLPAFRAVRRRYPRVKSKTKRALLSASEDLLEELWYERTEGRATRVGWADIGLSLGADLSKQKTRKPFTLPHLVDMWEQYLVHLTEDQGVFKKVVVFIDEIDKLKDADRIKECLLILKALYNAPNVVFVVSISEDAYRLFRRRCSSLAGRNAFDSTLDKVLLVRKIAVGELRGLMNRRMLGHAFSTPVTQLVWMLSKGNPRDAIRLARDIPERSQNGGLKEIGEVAWQLCREVIVRTISEYHGPSNDGAPQWELDGFRFDEAGSPEEFGGELDKAITRVEADGGGALRPMLAELKYVRAIWEEYGVRKDWRRCVVFDLYSMCLRSMQKVQHHLSNGREDKVCDGLKEYSSAMDQGVKSLVGGEEVAWAKLEQRQLQDMVLGLLDNGSRPRSATEIHKEMEVHANGMRIGKALEELEKRGLVQCQGVAGEDEAQGVGERWCRAVDRD